MKKIIKCMNTIKKCMKTVLWNCIVHTVLTWEQVAGVRTVLSAKRVCLFVCFFLSFRQMESMWSSTKPFGVSARWLA